MKAKTNFEAHVEAKVGDKTAARDEAKAVEVEAEAEADEVEVEALPVALSLALSLALASALAFAKLCDFCKLFEFKLLPSLTSLQVFTL